METLGNRQKHDGCQFAAGRRIEPLVKLVIPAGFKPESRGRWDKKTGFPLKSRGNDNLIRLFAKASIDRGVSRNATYFLYLPFIREMTERSSSDFIRYDERTKTKTPAPMPDVRVNTFT